MKKFLFDSEHFRDDDYCRTFEVNCARRFSEAQIDEIYCLETGAEYKLNDFPAMEQKRIRQIARWVLEVDDGADR